MADWSVLTDTQAFETDNADTSNSRGTSFAAGAGSKGSWSQLVAATGFDADGLWVQQGVSNGIEQIVDIGSGGSGSEQVIIANLLNGGAGADEVKNVFFPLDIPAGSRLAARSQVRSGQSGNTYLAVVLGAATHFSTPLQRVTTYGIDTSRTAGAYGIIVDAGASTNTKSSWVEVDAACANPIKYLTIVVNCFEQTRSAQYWLFDVAVGAAGSEQTILSNLWFAIDATNGPTIPGTWTLPCAIPAGTRLAVRAQSNTSTASQRRTAYALYGTD